MGGRRDITVQMNLANIVDNLIKDIKERLTLDGKNRVFNEGERLRSDFMKETAEAEAFTREFMIDKIFSAFELEKLPEKSFETPQGHRSVDYRIKSTRGMFLVEAKPLNADLEKGKDSGVNQIKGLFKLVEVQKNYDFGVATNGLRWIFIDRNEEIVDDLNLEEQFERIREFLVGEEKVVSPKTEEEVSKKFYNWYNALLHGGRYKDHANKQKTISEEDCLVNNVLGVKDLEEREQIAQVVTNRLIFIKFLQSKGIIGEDILKYLSEVKEEDLTPKLRQLFFDAMNAPKDERFYIDEHFKDIPYLNGSLFVHTGVERKNSGYKIKADILKKVIEFLDSFKFVHKEQLENGDPIDPEILGYIFERAMTATDRKGTGAYYTPKPITKYISENTIYSYIINKTNQILKDEKDYKETELINDIEELFILPATTLKEIWDKIIQKIRVLDNACGSGAFLLAAANILFELNRKISDKIGAENPDTTLKILILVNNLYGVDINPNGIEIAKLRLWLWLADSYEPRYIKPLPNIDYNLRVGNSLIGYADLSEFKEAKLTLSDYLWDEEKTTLYNLLKERNDLIRDYKISWGEEAKELKGSVHEFDRKISNMLNADLYQRFQEKKIKISKEEFLKLDPFHWGFEFYDVFDLDRQKEERGFDVVIGNPPYGAELNRIEKIWLKKRHECNRANNSAEYFFEKCFELIVQSGLVGYIVPKTIGFYSAWEDIRKYLLSKKVTHLFDVGIGFVGVNYEELVIIVKNQEYETFEESFVWIYKSKNLKTATGIKDAIFSGTLTQKLMRCHNKLIFSPINSPEDEMINYIEKSSIKFREIYNRAFRGLYISDKEKAQLKIGDISWIDKVPHVKRYYLSHIMKINIEKTEWQKKIEDIMVPRIFFKVLRGKRLVCFIDDEGKFLTTEKLVNVTLKDSSNYKLQTLMLILNSPLPSFYIQKMLFSDTTETSRVMDDIYVGEIPIPHPAPKNQQSFITLCNYMLFLNKTEERRKDEKALIEFIDLQIIDSIIYELYFQEKIEENGLKTKLLVIIEPYLKDIENLKTDEEILEVIKDVVEGIKSNIEIKKHIEMIKSHHWVKVINGGGAD